MSVSFDDVRKAIFDAKPVFRDVLAEHGDTTLFDYYAVHSVAPCPVSAERKEEFLSVFSAMVERILGSDVARTATADLRATWRVSTAEHHGILTDPYFGSSALVDTFIARAAGRTSVVSFPCAGISISNPSYPRGFIFHDTAKKEIRVPVVSRTHSGEPVYARAPFVKDVRQYIGVIHELVLETAEQRRLNSFSDQCTYINHALWKRIPVCADIDLVHISQEDLVSTVLLQYHSGTDTWLGKLLSDTQMQQSFQDAFAGIAGGCLFWGIEHKKRFAVYAGDSRIDSAEKIRAGLLSKTLMPAMSLTYCVLSFYYGITCAGGFSQVNYLTRMKTAFLLFAQAAGLSAAEVAVASAVSTTFFSGDVQLPVLTTAEGVVPATPLDLVLYASSAYMTQLQALARTVSLKDAVEPLFTSLYSIIAKGAVSKHTKTGYTVPHIYAENSLSTLRHKPD